MTETMSRREAGLKIAALLGLVVAGSYTGKEIALAQEPIEITPQINQEVIKIVIASLSELILQVTELGVISNNHAELINMLVEADRHDLARDMSAFEERNKFKKLHGLPTTGIDENGFEYEIPPVIPAEEGSKA